MSFPSREEFAVETNFMATRTWTIPRSGVTLPSVGVAQEVLALLVTGRGLVHPAMELRIDILSPRVGGGFEDDVPLLPSGDGVIASALLPVAGRLMG